MINRQERFNRFLFDCQNQSLRHESKKSNLTQLGFDKKCSLRLKNNRT